MVLKWQLPSDVEKACIVEMPKSLSPYLRLCSEIALQCRHQCKKPDPPQPEMFMKPVEINDFG